MVSHVCGWPEKHFVVTKAPVAWSARVHPCTPKETKQVAIYRPVASSKIILKIFIHTGELAYSGRRQEKLLNILSQCFSHAQ